MRSGFTPEALMVMGVIPFALGLVLLKLGRWPPRRGNVPHCRRCDYSLIGIQSARCPECGVDLTPGSIVHGERKRRFIPTLLGTFLIGIATFWIVKQGALVDWFHHAPTSLLIRSILTSNPALSKRIRSEVLRREESLS